MNRHFSGGHEVAQGGSTVKYGEYRVHGFLV